MIRLAFLFTFFFPFAADRQQVCVHLDINILGVHSGDVQADFNCGVRFGHVERRPDLIEPLLSFSAKDSGHEILEIFPNVFQRPAKKRT